MISITPGMTGDNVGSVYPGKFHDVDEPSGLLNNLLESVPLYATNGAGMKRHALPHACPI